LFSRNNSGAASEQTVVKAPDQLDDVTPAGTKLTLQAGEGSNQTGGSNDGSDGGGLSVIAGDGGASPNGTVGGDGGLLYIQSGIGALGPP
jgi:hypothetical protein